ncbi:partial D-alanyl-D-alanine carboxypeptidase, partial [uncultured bacterium]
MYQPALTDSVWNSRRKILLSLLLLLSLFLISCSDAPTIVNQSQSAIISRINMVTDSLLQATGVPGIVVGVWDPGKNISLQKGFGYGNPTTKSPLGFSDLFRIGSNTKSFVITVILQLVDEGKIRLTDKLSKYYPQFPRADEVTLHHLCTMSSGIFNYTNLDSFWEIYQSNP